MAISARTTAHKIAKAANARFRIENQTRFQLSLLAVGELSGRKVVDPEFMRELMSYLSGLGWSMFQITSTAYGVIKSSSAQGFRKLSANVLLEYSQRPVGAPAVAVEPEEDDSDVEQEGSAQVVEQDEDE